jgi:hypothetical protein
VLCGYLLLETGTTKHTNHTKTNLGIRSTFGAFGEFGPASEVGFELGVEALLFEK